MIYVPWIAFLLGMAYMIRQGFADKREYLRRKDETRERLKEEQQDQATQTAHEKVMPRTA
jgi:heme exporter protein D